MDIINLHVLKREKKYVHIWYTPDGEFKISIFYESGFKTVVIIIRACNVLTDGSYRFADLESYITYHGHDVGSAVEKV